MMRIRSSTGRPAKLFCTGTEKAFAEDEVVKQKTFCRSCPRACGVIAHIKNGRVIKLEGNPDDIFSQGGMCAKGLSTIQALYHPNRTKYPMKRIGERGIDNTWERISWDEAIDMIAKAMADMRDRYWGQNFGEGGQFGQQLPAQVAGQCFHEVPGADHGDMVAGMELVVSHGSDDMLARSIAADGHHGRIVARAQAQGGQGHGSGEILGHAHLEQAAHVVVGLVQQAGERPALILSSGGR